MTKLQVLHIRHSIRPICIIQMMNYEESVIAEAEHACLVSMMTMYLARYPRQGSLHETQLS